MRRAIVGVGGLTVLTILILFYQNCAQQGQPSLGSGPSEYYPSRSGKLNGRSCSESYHCRVYRYAPDMDDGKSTYPSCISLASGEQVCAEVYEVTYDSSRALQLCPDCVAADGRPGGKYNYAEIQCGSMNSEPGAFLKAQDARIDLAAYIEEAAHNCQSSM